MPFTKLSSNRNYYFYRYTWHYLLPVSQQTKTTTEQINILMGLNEKDYIKDHSLLLKSISVLGLTILGFILHSIIHVDAAVIAMTGATLLMLIGVKTMILKMYLPTLNG